MTRSLHLGGKVPGVSWHNKYPGYVTKLSELRWLKTLKFGKDVSDVTGLWRFNSVTPFCYEMLDCLK